MAGSRARTRAKLLLSALLGARVLSSALPALAHDGHGREHSHGGPPAAAAAPTSPAEIERRGQVVASFEGGAVTIGELEDAILAQNPFMQQRYVSADSVRALLDRSVRFALLVSEAERRGYGKADAVVQAQMPSAVQTLIKQEFDDKITAESIPASDVKQYYSAHIDEFVRGEGRRVSLMVLQDEASANQLLAQLQAADLRGFRDLVREKSLDETTKQRGGDLPYFDGQGRGFDAPDSTVDPAVAKAAFGLKQVGETSRPIQLGERYAILRLSGIRPAEDEAFPQAEERVRLRLWRQRRQAAIEAHVSELKQSQKVMVHRELVDAVKLDSGPPLPPSDGLPGGFPHTPETPAKNIPRSDSEPR
jgi:peptidyl-prolyl cis-trans isomerase C